MVVHAWYSTAWERKRQEFEDAWFINRVQGPSELNSKILTQKQKQIERKKNLIQIFRYPFQKRVISINISIKVTAIHKYENSFKLRISTENYTYPSPIVFSLMYKSVLSTTGFTLCQSHYSSTSTLPTPS